jgi:hypothetical protein
MNAELKASLGRCRALLKDCKSKLAANSNERDQSEEDEDTRVGWSTPPLQRSNQTGPLRLLS